MGDGEGEEDGEERTEDILSGWDNSTRKMMPMTMIPGSERF